MDSGGKYPPLVHGMTCLLEVKNLRVSYSARTGELCPALAGVNFDLGPGVILGVLGESGSGKSTLAAALLRLLPSNGKIQNGSVLFDGKNLLAARPQELRKIRGGRIGLISARALFFLHPTCKSPTGYRRSGRSRNFGSAHSNRENQPTSSPRFFLRTPNAFPAPIPTN